MSFTIKLEDWFKPKRYLHFDLPLNESQKNEVEEYVRDAKKIGQHSFYPFISYEVPKYKIIEESDGTRHLDPNAGKRPLSYASHWDSQIYSYYAQLMSVLYEQKLKDAGIGENVLAFRRLLDGRGESKCNIHLANEAFDLIPTLGECKVYAFDIKSFFDNLDHGILKQCWCELLGVTRLPQDHFQIYKSLSTYAIVKKSELYKTFSIPKKNPKAKGYYRMCNPDEFRNKVRGGKLVETKSVGIPQGSAMSALLANLYMFKFDKAVQTSMNSIGGYYFRYCDDILCILPIVKDFDVGEMLTRELNKIKLELNPKKSEVAVFSTDLTTGLFKSDRPIQYLGFIFDGKRKLIRNSSLARYRRKAKRAIRLAKNTRDKYNTKRIALGVSPQNVYRKKLFKKYFHTGKTNFIRYGLRASDIMGSKEIRVQIRKMQKFLIEEIKK